MSRDERGEPPTAEQCQALEASYTWRRLVELRLEPVQGQFDAAHLNEINRRIFQDLPGLGFDDVRPGEWRLPVKSGDDWMKTRVLETVGIRSNVAYSAMDEKSQNQLNEALKRADPKALSRLNTQDFTRAISRLYSEIDYIHPFGDGNSRTLREFTRQLADASGYRLDWERFGRSPAGRDVLYIARDRSVNELALPHVQDEGTKRAILLTMDQFESNRDLPDLLRDVIEPRNPEMIASERSLEEQLAEQEAKALQVPTTLERAVDVYQVKTGFDDSYDEPEMDM